MKEAERIRVDAPQSAPLTYDDPQSRAAAADLVRKGRNVGTALIVNAGSRHSAKVKWIAQRSAISTLPPWRIPVHGNRGDASVVGARICEDKALTKRFLRIAAVNTPRGKRVSSAKQAKLFLERTGDPVVIKPRFGTQGTGVSVNLRTGQDIDRAFDNLVSQKYTLVESFVPPLLEYRVLASNRECFSVVRRIPPHVRGDGTSTIRQLIEVKNAHRLGVPSTADTQIPTGTATEHFLRDAGLTLDAVLDEGVAVAVSGVGGVSGGAEPQECFDVADPRVKAIAVSAVASIPGLNWAGVDVVVDTNGDPCVLEVNSSADISSSAYPFFGTARDLGDEIWNRLAHRDVVSKALPTVKSVPPPIKVPELASTYGIETQTRFASLIGEKLRRSGHEVRKAGPELIQFNGDHGPAWLSGAYTSNDLAISGAFASIHGVVMKLADLNGIPTPHKQTITTPKQMEETLTDHDGSPRSFTPYKSSWKGGMDDPQKFMETWRDDSTARRVIVVQDNLPGIRLRVWATPTGVLLVLGDQAASERQITAACALAQKVAAMIPQLNWASVAIVAPNGIPVTDQVLLEGIVRRPVINPDDFVLAGSIDDALDYVISLAQARLAPYSDGNRALKHAEHRASSLRARAKKSSRRLRRFLSTKLTQIKRRQSQR